MRLNRLIITGVSAICTNCMATVAIDFVPIGDLNNPADPLNGNGKMLTQYSIGKYEVTNTQYTEFLNTVDSSGTNTRALYNSSMSTNANGGITFVSGNASGSKYVVKSGRGNNPVVFVSWYDAARMSNWLHNGQGAGSTESGVYTLTSNTGIGFPFKSTSAMYFLPNEVEWYKAAYYQPAANGGDTDGYWKYPTRSNTLPSNIAPSATSNSANVFYNGIYALTQGTTVNSSLNYLTDIGAYTNSASYYGTYDQLGNAWEWTDNAGALSTSEMTYGFGWQWDNGINQAFMNNLYWNPNKGVAMSATTENSSTGFRLASNPSAIPEPGMVLATVFALPFLRRRN